MVTVEKAKSLIKSHSAFLERIEEVETSKALGKLISEDLFAPMDLPSFDQSAVDGFGFNLNEDLFKKNFLAGEIKAGDPVRSASIKESEFAKIYTGAPVSVGMNCIVMQEYASISEGALNIPSFLPKIGDNIRYKGSHIKKGELALKKGTRINPALIGLVSALGINKIKVFSRPVVNLIITGNEIRQPDMSLSEGKIFDSNSVILSSALSGLGIGSVNTYYSKDDFSAIKNLLKEIILISDVLIISGGISVGKYDFVKGSLDAIGVIPVFYKVAQKPGKPLYFGKYKDTLIFALPGNPAAVVSCFYEYIYPSLRKMMGYSSCFLPQLKMPVLKEVQKKNELSVFLKARMQENGVLPLEGQESFILKSFNDANALIYLPMGLDRIEKYHEVEVHCLPEY